MADLRCEFSRLYNPAIFYLISMFNIPFQRKFGALFEEMYKCRSAHGGRSNIELEILKAI